MRDDYVILTDINWDAVDMDPMTGTGQEPYENVQIKRMRRRTATVAVTFTLLPFIFDMILLISGLVLLLIGVKVIGGEIPAPEFTYEQFTGLGIVIAGVMLMRAKHILGR